MSVTRKFRKVKGGGKSSQVYEAQVYVRGVRVETKTFDTKTAAMVWHDETKRLYLDGKAGRRREVDITFSACFERYVRERLPELREQTRQTQSIRHKYLTESPLVNIRMLELSAIDINKWFSWLKTQPTADNKCRKNWRHEFNLLRAVLNWYRDEINEEFVVPIVKRHREKVYFKTVPARRADYFIPVDDLKNWLFWLRDHRSNPVYFRLAAFLILTGCRVGEAAGLYWDAVNLEEKYISIIRTVWWDHHSKRPNLQPVAKTETSEGLVNLADCLVELLKEMSDKADKAVPVFQGKGSGLLKYNAIQSAFNAGFKALGLPWRSTHICRHTNGTHALDATRDLSAVQAALRHATIRDTERYAKVIKLRDRSVAEKTAKALNLAITEKITEPDSEAENS